MHLLFHPRRRRLSVASLAVVAAFSMLPQALAQRADWTVEHFEPAPDQGNNILQTVSSRLLPHLTPSFGVFVHFAKDPLVFRKLNDDTAVGEKVIEDQLLGELWASIGLFDYVNVSLVMPLALMSDGAGLTRMGQGGFAPGDMRIIPKVKLVDWQESGGFGLALSAEIIVPTGDVDSYRGDGAVRFQPRLILDGHNDFFQVCANFGYQTRPRRVSQGLVYDDVFRWSVGLAIPTVDELQILLNAFGNFQMESDEHPYTGANSDTRTGSPIDVLAGLQFRLPYDLVVQVGGGLGLNRAVGAPEYRAFLSLGYTPSTMDRDADGIRDAVDACPEQPEDFDDYDDEDGCPERDNDSDGIDDSDDQCPSEPEDLDEFEDDDGCPDDDNDKDGVRDAKDSCPLIAEDKDGFEDADGCPEPDNDGDGINDTVDACPLVAEDKDGFEDADGCPDPDNDNDGIPDARDKCPTEKETVNGFEDADGCPDTKPKPPPGRVMVTGLKIEITEKVFFKTGKATIKKRSYSLLREVAKVMRENPQLTRVRIEGHTDSSGGAGYNRRLSQSRAKAVRRFLINQRVASSRLESIGYGEDRPRMTNTTRAGRKANRRVEFAIVTINGKPASETP